MVHGNVSQMAELEGAPGIKVDKIQLQENRSVFQDGQRIIILASGRLLNLGRQPFMM